MHIGSITECEYALRPFGIQTRYLPANLNIRARDYQRQQQKWLEQRKALEALLRERQQNESNSISLQDQSIFVIQDVVLCPRREDCLFGKGQPIMKHPGNVSMRKLLEQRWERYETSLRTDIQLFLSYLTSSSYLQVRPSRI